MLLDAPRVALAKPHHSHSSPHPPPRACLCSPHRCDGTRAHVQVQSPMDATSTGFRCPPRACTILSHLPAAQVQHEPPLLCLVLPSLPAPGLGVLDVEFEGCIGCQILQVAGHPDLHT